MSDADDKKLRELEKEFRETVVSELRHIKVNQSSLETCLEKLDKKLDLNIQKVEYELKSINQLDETQNKLLDEHMKRSDSLENLYQTVKKEHEVRLRKLEEPRRLLLLVRNISLGIGGILGAVYTVGKIIGWF